MPLSVNSNMPRDINYKALIPIGGAIIFAGVAGYLYYKLLKKDEEVDDFIKEGLPFLKLTTIEVKIPSKVIGAVIGRQGSNIKRLQENTSTVINFRDEENGEKTCIIKGKLEKVEKAKELLLSAIKEIPEVESEELHIPDNMIGRIIGRNGETIQNLQRVSGAKIQVSVRDVTDSANQGSVAAQTRKIIIKGTKEQLSTARLKILEKLEDEERLRTQIQNSACKISQRSKGTNQQNHENGETSNDEEPSSIQEASFPTKFVSSTTYNEVYVSAVASGAHFWVQVVGPKTVQLEKLVTEMSEFYEDPENRESHSISDFETNKIVAAKFNDGMWYRGRICSPDEDEEEKEQITVYFVDFGDTDNVDMENICLLRTDFLRLGFQAIECYLANVDLESALHDVATDAFEALSYAAQWKPLMVRVMGYKRDGDATIPLVKVVDTNGHDDMDIAEEMVKRGFAKRPETNGSSAGLTLISDLKAASNG